MALFSYSDPSGDDGKEDGGDLFLKNTLRSLLVLSILVEVSELAGCRY